MFFFFLIFGGSENFKKIKKYKSKSFFLIFLFFQGSEKFKKFKSQSLNFYFFKKFSGASDNLNN